ncbi:replication-relaxation family protein [Candidatus Sulfurimonas baltica]|uniref:Replication-relaxation family protein n=1 Tax=Candidatus Sulfurimonas baltica TaxID=2740404 RepID=A0A7S7RN20_9BACT|nr:replication-relaxation family protein [Candidatus Sulfurimonas baltica]QOY51975.1 replication-relaxation family protein [Candidatus Sulfurimonas baltica]
MYLKDKHIEAMKHIATYKFLTSSQLVKLGLNKHRGDVTNNLKQLTDQKRPLIDKITFPVDPEKGKLESIYYLTSRGVKFLIEDLDYPEDQIKATKSKPTSTQTYFHRKSTIDFHICLREWLNCNDGSVVFLNYDFDKVGNNRSKDRIQHLKAINSLELDNGVSFIPDAITKFKVAERDYLFLFEQHNGKSSKRLIEQLCLHAIAISEGIASQKYNFERSNRVVVVCEFETLKNIVTYKMKQMKIFDNLHNFFIFKTNDEMKNYFFSDWSLISGQKVDFI